ncbi:MAG: hypothetical protein ONB44_08905 [candidate division KSB1 bacterium]|nr:hypothetical protein [candidate division KSB1 bacterium]MDZ7302250.1 hypothetical protein [candidate division KSB1 bacterium]MDZ7311356.1 hypothetical protein [candidate division KSB1 bacterium]
MEGKEFLAVAQKLLQMRSEAAIRSAASRTYYAIFNTGVKLLNELGFVLPKDAPAHEQLYHRLHNSGTPVITEIAIWIKHLQMKRIRADYEMASTEFHSHHVCEFDIVRANLIIQRLESCYQQPLRNQLKDGIQEYERKIGFNS